MSNLYQLDGKVPVVQAIPFGLQHVLAMFVANITPIIILANVVGLDTQLSAALIQNCMIIAGIGTLVQLYPIWRIGSRLPIVMGISFTFLSLAIVIATTQGMGTLMGAIVIGGIVEGVLGLFLNTGQSSSHMSLLLRLLQPSASHSFLSAPTHLPADRVLPISALPTTGS